MKYKNNGPVTFYIVMDTQFGNLAASSTNLNAARSSAKSLNEGEPGRYVVLAYDQRGTRGG